MTHVTIASSSRNYPSYKVMQYDWHEQFLFNHTGKVSFVADKTIDVNSLLGEYICLQFNDQTAVQYFYVTQTQEQTHALGILYTLRLSRLHPQCLMPIKTHEFCQLTLSQLVKEAISLVGVDSIINCQLAEDITIAYVVLQDENILQFIQRVSKKYGLFFVLSASVRGVTWQFYDSFEKLSQVTRHHCPIVATSDMVTDKTALFNVEKQSQLTPKTVLLEDYFPFESSKVKTCTRHSSQTNNQVGHWHVFGQAIDDNLLVKQTDVLMRQFDASGEKITATTHNTLLKMGDVITLQHSDNDNKPYIIIEKHTIGQSQLPGYDTANNHAAVLIHLSLIPCTAKIISELNYTNHVISSAKASSITLAKTCAFGSYARMDEKGCYQVDLQQANTANQSAPYRRLMTPAANDNAGMHFPLNAGSEVLVAPLHDNPDKSFILGALYNNENKNPVNSQNPQAYHLSTPQGHTLSFTEDNHECMTLLSSPQQQNFLCFQQKNHQHEIALTTCQGDITLNAHKVITHQAKNIMYQVENHMNFEVKNNFLCRSLEGELIFYADKAIEQKANRITFTVGEGGMRIDCTDKFEVTAQQALSLTAKKDINFKSQNDFTVDADAISLCVKNGQLILKNNQSEIILDNQGNIELKANAIHLDANKIVQKARFIPLMAQSVAF